MILLLASCWQQSDGNAGNASDYDTMTVKRSDITLEQAINGVDNMTYSANVVS